MKLKFGSIALVALLMAAPARADDCRSLAEIKAIVEGGAINVTDQVMNAEQSRLFIDRFNALPPVSHLDADQVLLAKSPEHESSLAVLFKNGCYVIHVSVKAATLRQIMGEPT